MNNLKTSLTIGITVAAFSAGLFLIQPQVHTKEGKVVWQEHFTSGEEKGVPKGWRLEGKPGTPKTIFSIEKDPKDGEHFLQMEADKATASIITDAEGVDLKETPILRWKWRVDELPQGADGREKSKDDQAIGIYVGSGGMLSNKSVSYRWDTNTPKGSKGSATYGGGIAKVKWYTLRNKEEGTKKWIVEERNVAKDFEEAWGHLPKDIYVSVCCNSQYTGTEARADLEWIEFVSITDEDKK